MWYSSRTFANLRFVVTPWIVAGFILLQVPAPGFAQEDPDSLAYPSVARLSNQYGTLVISEEADTTPSSGLSSQLVVFTDPDGHTISMTFTENTASDSGIRVEAVIPGGTMLTQLSDNGIAHITMIPTSDPDSALSFQFPVDDQDAIEATVSSDEYLSLKTLMITPETSSVLANMRDFLVAEGIIAGNSEPASSWQGQNKMNEACRQANIAAALAWFEMMLACVWFAEPFWPAACALGISQFVAAVSVVAHACG